MMLGDVLRQFWFGAVVILALGFGGGWGASSWRHSGDTCDALTETYEFASSGFYKSGIYDVAAESYRYNRDVYGQDVAQEIADARASGADLPESVLLGSLIDNGCTIPSRSTATPLRSN